MVLIESCLSHMSKHYTHTQQCSGVTQEQQTVWINSCFPGHPSKVRGGVIKRITLHDGSCYLLSVAQIHRVLPVHSRWFLSFSLYWFLQTKATKLLASPLSAQTKSTKLLASRKRRRRSPSRKEAIFGTKRYFTIFPRSKWRWIGGFVTALLPRRFP